MKGSEIRKRHFPWRQLFSALARHLLRQVIHALVRREVQRQRRDVARCWLDDNVVTCLYVPHVLDNSQKLTTKSWKFMMWGVSVKRVYEVCLWSVSVKCVCEACPWSVSVKCVCEVCLWKKSVIWSCKLAASIHPLQYMVLPNGCPLGTIIVFTQFN